MTNGHLMYRHSDVGTRIKKLMFNQNSAMPVKCAT